jgi:hypothetical protein
MSIRLGSAERVCDSCAPSFIQYGTLAAVVHESGCQRSDGQRLCRWCGSAFLPVSKSDRECGHSCRVAYTGVECSCEECSR